MLRILHEGPGPMTVDIKPPRRKVNPAQRIRHYGYVFTPTPLARLDPDDPGAVCAAIRAHADGIRRKRSCGAYVFVCPDLKVYVLSEESSVATDWIAEEGPKGRLRWLVALYHAKTVQLRPQRGDRLGPPVQLGLDGLEEDLREHLHDLARSSRPQVPGGM